ncbi:MAG: alpha/beta hydrolase [Vicinamibacterales bacterium]
MTLATWRWAVRIAASLLLFLSAWIVVPAPTMALLALGVGVPELSPVLLVVTLVAGVIAWRTGATGALVLCAIAATLFAVPIAQYPRGAPLSVRCLLLGVPAPDSRVTRGVQFAAPQGVPLTVDIYQPRATGRVPTVVQIYGGAWQRGVPGDDEVFARHVASQGYVVFAIDYRHAPTWKWPAQQEDVRAALEWIRAHAPEYEADPSKLAIVGRSAGAQLAMVTALQDRAVSAVVSYYGPVNLARGWREPPRPDPIGSRGVLEAYVGGTPDQVPDRYREASPITYVSATAPRSLLIYGARDHVVQARFGRELHEALLAAGARSELVVLPWAEHAFDIVTGGLGGQLSLFHTERFLADVFR